jgi:pSer/pThr/pTyr-binding forkhead associated (FHA) protein
VNHASVSRHHAAIESQYGSTKVRDLSSQNGTFVSERRVSEAYLSDGDSVRLGDAPFTFRA